MNGSSRYLPPFEPLAWLKGGNRQTIVGTYWPGERYSRSTTLHQVELSGGDQLVMHDEPPETWREGQRVAAIFHGLGGSHRSPYVIRTASKLRSRGIRTVCVDMRGYGSGVDLAAKPGHAGRSEDAAAVVIRLAELFPSSPLTLVGFSLGANIVLKLAGETGTETLGNLDSCWAASPPIDIAQCAANMRQKSRQVYSRAFLRNLIRQVRKQRRRYEEIRQIELHPMPRFVDEFDDRFTAPLSGFRDVHHYYAEASSAPLLRNITIPTQIIAAHDDPIVPIDAFQTVEVSDTVHLHTTESGGHLGYVGRQSIDPDRRWLDWRAVDWVLEQGLRAAEKQ